MEARQIIERIGEERLASALGLSPYSIRKAWTNGRMPASWYVTVRRLAAERDENVSYAAFRFKATS